MEKVAAERLSWFESFIPLYEKAVPIINHIANLETLAAGELSTSPYVIAASNLTLRPILEALKTVHEPKEEELGSIQREFQIALSSCIKAVEAAVKYIELEERGIRNQAALNTIINSTVLAHEYIESVSKKLEISRTSGLGTKLESKQIPGERHLKNRRILDRDNISPPVQQPSVIDKVANGIELALDKLGNVLVFPIVIIVKVTTKISSTIKQKTRRGHHT